MRNLEKSDRVRQGIIFAQVEYRKIFLQMASLSLAIAGLPVLFFKNVFQVEIESGSSLFFTVSTWSNIPFLALFLLSYVCIGYVFYSLHIYLNYNITMTRKTHYSVDPVQMWKEEKEAKEIIDRYFDRASIFFAASAAFMILSLLFFVKP